MQVRALFMPRASPAAAARPPRLAERHRGAAQGRRRIIRMPPVAPNGSPEIMIVMRASASADDVRHIVGLIEEAGAAAHVSEDGEATLIGAIGDRAQIAVLPLEGLPGVARVLPLRKAYRWVSREFFARDTVVDVGGRQVGAEQFMLI